jgi:predicted dehydrogenase
VKAPLRLGVAGVGQVARQNYIPFLKNQPDVELGFWNRTPETARTSAEELNAPAFSTLADLAAWQPDSVLVLTAETARHAVALELISLGVPRLFLEKPLVAALGQAHVTEQDFVDGKSLLAAARDKNCETAMIFNYRFFAQTIEARRIALERNFGTVVHVLGQVHYACWSHAIDLIHYFAGDLAEITALSGEVERAGQGIVAADVVAAFRLESGGTGTLIGTAGMAWQYPLYELTFTFERGRLHLRDIDGTLEVMDSAGRVHETRTFVRDNSRWESYGESFRGSLSAYIDSLRAGTPPPVPGLDGLRELRFEAALKRSATEKRPIAVTQEFPLFNL